MALKKFNSGIAKSSPLYGYWQTLQDDIEEQKRLLLINKDNPASQLFKDEPYKWESLYQSIVREIYRGDISSIKAFNIILDTLKEEERKKVLFKLKEFSIFNDDIIKLINNNEDAKALRKRKIFRYIRILVVIFTNPYCIELKRKKLHLYERTGSIVNSLRKFFI
tara:strand:+ start:1337 stop:1831 length:495 start_codon:yes stop_codon:yes gene_type:complete